MSKLPLQAVKKIVTVIVLMVWAVVIKYAPMRRAVFPYGSESKAKEIFCTIGNTIPPPRAVLDGVAGEIIKSVQASA